MSSKTVIQAFASTADAEWAATLMAESQPWVTLDIGYERSLGLLGDASRECYLAKVDGERAGFLMISMQGAFVGFIQLLGVAAIEHRLEQRLAHRLELPTRDVVSDQNVPG